MATEGFFGVKSQNLLVASMAHNPVLAPPREIIHSYAKKMYELAIYMGEKIAEGLGVKSASFEKWQSQFRMVKYSFKEGTPGGLQTHTDSGFITILQDDDTVAGFEALDGSGNFITIDPLPGSLVVNIGDMVQVWSNDRFKTMKHRVVCKETAVRISIVLLFLAPQNGVVMEAPEELIDADHPRRYKPITFEENRKLRLATSKREGQVLELFRID